MEVYDGAHALAKLITASEEYEAYSRLKASVFENETNAALLKEYKRLQTALQLAAMSGVNMDQDDMQRFSQMSTLLYASQETSAYLLSEMRFQKMLADVFKILTDAAGMPFDLPGM